MRLEELIKAFQESRLLSIPGKFEKFLDQKINIGKGLRQRAGISQNHVRDFLNEENGRDEGFPRILRNADSDFLGGSFARHTKIWPLDDIDIYFPLDGEGLSYCDSYGQMSSRFRVQTDDVINQNPLVLSDSRWMKDGFVSSRKIIDGFAQVLRRRYPKATKVKRVGEAVNVQLSIGQTEENGGLGFDIVPCFALKQIDSAETDFYLIPDGDDGWIRTNPKLDMNALAKVNKANGGVVKKAIKILKWWCVENKLENKYKSYFVELSVIREFQRLNSMGYCKSDLLEAVKISFFALKDAVARGTQEPLLDGAPLLDLGFVDQDDYKKIVDAANELDHAWAFGIDQKK